MKTEGILIPEGKEQLGASRVVCLTFLLWRVLKLARCEITPAVKTVKLAKNLSVRFGEPELSGNWVYEEIRVGS